MQSILFGLGLLAILAAWRFAWRRTALDDARDRLFDLRSGVREEFLRRGWGLDHPMYKALFDLLSGHLRYTEAVRFSGFVAFHIALSGQPDVRNALRAQVERRFSCENEELTAYCKEIRQKASFVMLTYVTETSALAMALVAVGLAIIAVRQVSKGVRSFANLSWKKIGRAAVLSSALFATLQPAHASPDEVQTFMEDHAFSLL